MENLYRKNNIKCDITDIPTKYPSIYSFKVECGGVFNPVKYLMKLRDIIGEKVDIYENTGIIKLEKKNDYYKAYTDSGNIISSKYVIVCTHYPFFIVPFFLPFKSSVEKSYLVCGECKENSNMQLISDEVSFRYYKLKNKNYFIYGRCSHKVSDFLDDRDSYNEILDESFELMADEIGVDDTKVMGVYGAMARGLSKEEALKKYDLSEKEYDDNVDRVLNG